MSIPKLNRYHTVFPWSPGVFRQIIFNLYQFFPFNKIENLSYLKLTYTEKKGHQTIVKLSQILYLQTTLEID